MTFTNSNTSNEKKQFSYVVNPLSLHLFSFFTVSLSHFEKLPHLSRTAACLPPSPLGLLTVFYIFFLYCEFRCLLSWGAAVRGLRRDGSELMNEGCLWLLGEESGFNLSVERRPRKALLEQGGEICEGWCVAGRDRWA